MNLNTLINDCRAICMTGRLDQFWDKCNSLARGFTNLDNDQLINVAITQVDSIITDNDAKNHSPFNLGLLLMRKMGINYHKIRFFVDLFNFFSTFFNFFSTFSFFLPFQFFFDIFIFSTFSILFSTQK